MAERDDTEDALRKFDAIIDAVQDERYLALEDRRFVDIAGAMWEGPWGEQFANTPMVEHNKTAAGRDKIINQYRANRVTVNFRPADEKADEETATLLDGMFRADAYRSNASQAFDNAFDEGVSGGYGAWCLGSEYEDEFDPEDERQRISFHEITDADQSVFWDMSSKKYDKSDAKFCFVLSTVTVGTFKVEHPEKAVGVTDWPQGLWKPHYDWYTPDVVRIAKLYEVEIKKEKRRIFFNPVTAEERQEWNSDIDEDEVSDLLAAGWEERGHVMRKRRRVYATVFTGCHILEPKRAIAGSRIPVVMFYGQRRVIDGMERCQGHVRKAKDPQRTYNAQISKLVETAATSPVERPIFDPEQVAGFEQHWADANQGRHPYALARVLRNEDGTIAAAGAIGSVTPPQVQPAVVALVQLTSADIDTMTNAQDGADEVKANISAEAMDIAATRTDDKSAIYMDNMKLSMKWCGEVYKSMAPDVYVEEGRKVETLDENEQDGDAILKEPFTDEQGRFKFRNDLQSGKYKVVSDVTEATATRRDRTVKNLINIAQVSAAFDPELASAALNTAILQMDGEGMTDFQEWDRARMVRQGIVKPTDEEKQAMEQEQQGQQPDPTQLALLAQAKDLDASATLKGEQAKKAIADTSLSQAKEIETLASAAQKGADTDKTKMEALNPPANDAEPRPLPKIQEPSF